MRSNTTDQEQVEMLKKWWKDYGKGIMIAIVIGLAVGFGWRYWHQQQIQHSEQASIAYQSMMVADVEKQPKVAQKYADQLLKDFRDTSYASMAGLFLARTAVQQNKLPDALARLQEVINKGKVASIKQIARIRAARVLLAQKKLAEALAVLSTVDDKTFEPLIENVKGDIFQAQGKGAAARKSYEAAKTGLSTIGINNPILVMKLAQPLGGGDSGGVQQNSNNSVKKSEEE